MSFGRCRFCSQSLNHSFADLGYSPLANTYLTAEDLTKPEITYPLHAFVCENCFLVQVHEFESPQHIFGDYPYFSSYSQSWLRHAEAYANMMIDKFSLNNTSQVIEVASNDGYLLKYFKARGIPVLGIEPATNVAKVAVANGIPTVNKFFGVETAKQVAADGYQADVMCGNNVLAHVPNINDFVGGMPYLLKPGGVLTMEFPHLLRLIEKNEFDTIYHEHFSYISLLTAQKLFEHHGMRLFDVEEIPTHGGSVRIYACHAGSGHQDSGRVGALIELERKAGLDKIATYTGFQQHIEEIKCELLEFLLKAKRAGHTVAGYGAPAKGTTLLNYCGARREFVVYTVDRSPHKQNHYLPGLQIPIHAPEKIFETKPTYVLLLAWNLAPEIMEQMAGIKEWGGKFVIPIPKVQVVT